MESLELRIFWEVAYAGSITKASENMCYAQSNVTAHIRHLEQEIGVTLFVRHSKGVTLTEKGKQLLRYADQVVHLLDEAKQHLTDNKPILKIGATQTIAAHALPIWLDAFARVYPQTRFSVSTGIQSQLLQAVADGGLDCAFVNTQIENSKVIALFSMQENLALITPENRCYEESMRLPLVASDIPGCRYRGLLESWVLRNTGIPAEVITFDTLAGIIKAVALGWGISLLPRAVVPENEPLRLFCADEIGATFIRLAASNNTINPAVRNFSGIIRSHTNAQGGCE